MDGLGNIAAYWFDVTGSLFQSVPLHYTNLNVPSRRYWNGPTLCTFLVADSSSVRLGYQEIMRGKLFRLRAPPVFPYKCAFISAPPGTRSNLWSMRREKTETFSLALYLLSTTIRSRTT